VPEWSNGAVSKTVEPLWGSEGSNPSLSANLYSETTAWIRGTKGCALLIKRCLALLNYPQRQVFRGAAQRLVERDMGIEPVALNLDYGEIDRQQRALRVDLFEVG
jgi:hypothetical protein